MLIFQKIIYLTTIISAIYVICLNNVIHSIFSLVITILSASIFLLSLGLEFLGLIYIMVYIGAILVLFLFVILSFNNKDNLLGQYKFYFLLKNHIFLAFSILPIFYIKYFTLLLDNSNLDKYFINKISQNYFYSIQFSFQDIQIIGLQLYTQTFPYLIICGVILLIVMIGVICISLEQNPYKLQQNYKNRTLKSLLIYKN
jgi:NADH:ubiquinone oxidoreductase subunit 6 (subunit J)